MKKIKIQPKYRKRTWDEIIVPEIKIEGKWLEESGFEYGKYVSVNVQPNKLTITLNEERADNRC